MASQLTQKFTTKQRNDLVWDSMKAEIHQLLIVDGKTLPETMDVIKDRHSFSKSERKWKMKLQEWKFNKRIPAVDMTFMVNRADKRLREEDKETALYYKGSLVEQRRLDNFKKKNSNKDSLVLDVATPADVTYHTPSSMDVDSVELEPGSRPMSTIVNENHGSDRDTSELMEGTVPSRSQQPAITDFSESSDPSYTDSPSVAPFSLLSSTFNEERQFPLLVALRAESAGRDGHIASIERSRQAFHVARDSQDFTRITGSPVTEEDLSFLIDVIETLRNGCFAEEYPNLLFPSDFASINRRPPGLWDEFSELIDLVLFEQPSSLHSRFSRFAELVLSCEAAFGLANCLAVFMICRYADVLFIKDLPLVAEDLLRGIITELPSICLTLRLHCRLSLAAILFVTQSTSEAVEILTSVIRSGLHSLHHPYPSFYVYLTWSSRLLEIIWPHNFLMAGSILFSITKIKRMVLQNRSGRVSQDRTWVTVLTECGNVAEKLSRAGEFSRADQLFSSITTAMVRFSPSLHGTQLSCIFIARGSHHRRQNKIQEFGNDIWNAYHFLSPQAGLELSVKAKLESMRPLLEEAVDQLGLVGQRELKIIAEELRVILTDNEWEFDQLENIGGGFYRHSPIELSSDEVGTDDLDDIVLVDDSALATQSTEDNVRELIIPIRGDSSWEAYEIPMRKTIGQEDNMTICTSNKYGVTFSVSEMTGISYSEFMMP